MRRIILAVLALVIFLTSSTKGQDSSELAGKKSEVLDLFLSGDSTPPLEYSVTRFFEAGATISGYEALMEVETNISPERGFTFHIVSESGSGRTREQLHNFLEEEKETIEKNEGDKARLTPQNYTFNLSGEESGVWKLGLRAKGKSKLLVNGNLFVDPAGELLRLEGKMAKSPSWKLSDVQIVRNYKRIAGVRLPTRMESTAKVRWLPIRAKLTVRYEYKSVNYIDLTTVE